MSGKRYTEEFKVAAVKQVIDRGQAGGGAGLVLPSFWAGVKGSYDEHIVEG